MLRAALCVLLLVAGWAQAAPARLHLTTEEAFPSSFLKDGRIVGFSTDKMREALRRAGIGYDLEMLPWPRALGLAHDVPSTCVYPTARTPEREQAFRWVGPVARTEWWLYGLASRNYRIAKLEDARRLRIGAYLGDVRADFLRARGLDVEAVARDELNARKLMLGRIDLWVTGPLTAQRILEQNGLTDEIAPVLLFNSIDLYLACEPSTPEPLLRRVQAALDAMARDGTSDKIDRRYNAALGERRAR